MVNNDAPEDRPAEIPVEVRVDVRVIYGDTDQMGVVYYANYLRYFEAGRNEYLRACGIVYRDFEERFQVFLPVAEAQVSYRRPARYDDLLAVHTRLAKIGRASVRFEYRVQRGDELLVAGHTVHACVSRDGAVTALPPSVLPLLRPTAPGR
jgi:acyl-CoA thioester hydrolase